MLFTTTMFVGNEPAAPGIDVDEQAGAGRRAVAVPELDSVRRVVVGEVQRAVEHRELRRLP